MAAAAAASSSSCSEPMSSSDLATTRLLASVDRVCGRLVTTCSPPRRCLFCRAKTAAWSRRPSPATSAGVIRPVSTVMSQDAALAPSPPGPSASGFTSIGP